MKYKKLKIAIFLIFIIIVYFFVNSNKATNNNNLKQITTDNLVPSSPAEVKYPDLNPKELEEYYQTYKNPFILHIRKALNGYLQGTNEGISTPNVVVKAHIDQDGLTTGLDSFSKDYYRSKFVVVSFDNFQGGGKQVSILFQDKPDKLFSAWVYELKDGTYDLRGFWQNDTYTGKKLQDLNKQFKIFLNDKSHSL